LNFFFERGNEEKGSGKGKDTSCPCGFFSIIYFKKILLSILLIQKKIKIFNL
jgi:hypothetical protein